MKLKISDSVSLPADAVTQTYACIGRKGAGKTYLASLLAEQMIDIGAQVIIMDPVGNWWGLRVAADGKRKGKDIFIAGGEHGDVPMLPTSGATLAKIVVEKNISLLLDVSNFRQGERKRFAADFAEEFFHLKKTQRSAVHFFVEEAQLFIPQRCGAEEARMLGAFENIIRLGRNYGIGATLISQRPQSVNKEVLSQVECLCVLQVNGSHERKALEEWVQEAGADRKLVGELPGLGRGEGYVWSPAWLRMFQRVRFGKKVTFDASATPEVGKANKAALLSKVDVEALKADLREVIVQAERDDPKVLNRRIAELEKQLQNRPSVETNRIPDIEAICVIASREVEAIVKKLHQNVGMKLSKKLEELGVLLESEARKLRYESSVISHESEWGFEYFSDEGMKALKNVRMVDAPPKPQNPAPILARPIAPKSTNGSGELTGPEQRILNAIAWFESIGINQPEQPAVAFLAGYTYGGGAYNNPRGRLNVRGLVSYVPGERISLTPEGQKLAEYPDTPAGNEQLQESVLGRLPGPEQRLLRPLLKAYPKPMSNQDLADAAGYTAGAGAFNNPRGRLKTLGLIEYPQPGMVRARELLFPN